MKICRTRKTGELRNVQEKLCVSVCVMSERRQTGGSAKINFDRERMFPNKLRLRMNLSSVINLMDYNG